jgi:hypothetical protein
MHTNHSTTGDTDTDDPATLALVALTKHVRLKRVRVTQRRRGR